jgi:16S rRNA (cytidine1402-2'-O)-methyltransferase
VSTTAGKLYVVATPIGNLSDISPRAAEILAEVDLIAAEDKRHSIRLLNHLGVQTPLFAMHEHNERDTLDILIERLQNGADIAVISDAGTPLISDPGYLLVRQAQSQGITVHPIPGPCAAVAALSAGGLPTVHFLFQGFLSSKQGARLEELKLLAQRSETLVFYEAPHRLLKTLGDMRDTFGGEREAVLARELTKQFETIRRDRLSALCDWVASDADQQRGEAVILVAGCVTQQDEDAAELTELLSILLTEVSLKQAVNIAIKLTQHKKNFVYQLALQLQSREGNE